MCGSCAAKVGGLGISNCKTHGKDYIELKCRYCCQSALWFCFGTTHFCDPCHNGARVVVKCDPNVCQLKGDHIPNG